MTTLQLDCGKCKKQLHLLLHEVSFRENCPNCGTEIRVEAFRALLKEDGPVRRGEALLIDDESSCFYHPSKKAVVPCEACGRFLCSLCDIELDGRHLCSTCIEKNTAKGKLERLQNERIRYDEIALDLAVLSILFFFIGFIIAPASLSIAIRHWKKPMSIVHTSKWRFVTAMVIACLCLAGWGLIGVRLLSRIF